MDHASPGWETQIDVLRLDIGDPTACIIAQVRPRGLGYFAYTNLFGWNLFGGWRWARRNGFESGFHFGFRKLDAEVAALQEAWLNEIGGRVVNSIIEKASVTSEKESIHAGN